MKCIEDGECLRRIPARRTIVQAAMYLGLQRSRTKDVRHTIKKVDACASAWHRTWRMVLQTLSGATSAATEVTAAALTATVATTAAAMATQHIIEI